MSDFSHKELIQQGNKRKELGAIVSFENSEGKSLVLHGTGNSNVFMNDLMDEALWYDPTFRVVSISNPATIFTDLQGIRAQPGKSGGTRIFGMPPELQILNRVRRPEMLHPRLRKYEKGRS